MPHYTFDTYQDASEHSLNNRDSIMKSLYCGCYSCFRTFHVSYIKEFIDDDQTAICPYCEVDAVIGDHTGYPIEDITFLEHMSLYGYSDYMIDWKPNQKKEDCSLCRKYIQ
jgi:hypothetical protein